MTTAVMKCGDVASGTSPEGDPLCAVHAGTRRDAEAREIAEGPPLEHRKSRCGSCGRVANSDGTNQDGTRAWRGPQPFLSVNPNYDEAADRLDSHYDGCAGWD